MDNLSGSNRKPNLALIGYRATGKTGVGKFLADRLQRPFVDLDQVLVEEAGQSIAELVAKSGWEEFRRREKQLVARYGVRPGLVLATGGGVVLDWENVLILRRHGIIIWLTADPATIRARLVQDRPLDTNRPSLTGGDTVAEVAQVLQARQHLYLAAARIIIDTAGRSIEQVAECVLTAIRGEGINLGG